MAYEEFDARNMSEGLIVPFEYVGDIVPAFYPLVLFAFFFVITISVYISTVMRGKSDFPAAFAVASWATFVLSALLMVAELVNPMIVIICLTISIVAMLLLFATHRD